MKILIIGNGGREHAIGIKLLKDNPDAELFFAKGNGGTASIGTNINSQSVEELASFAKEKNIDLTIVGSEALLVEGIVDAFIQNELKIFGPHKAAAMLEGDKAFAKLFMQEFGVRTAHYQNFTNAEQALVFIKTQRFPLVIKATGLAAGKGVFIVNDIADAEKTIHSVMVDKSLGEAGNEIVIEEFLQGFEVSVLAVFNGKEIYPMISAKDHKKLLDNDEGPNTGGMGAVAPNPLYTKILEEDFNNHILQPTLTGLKQKNLLFAGVIFFGLMICNNQCYLLEYNMRMGDPETQAILPLLDSNFLEMIDSAINRKPIEMQWKQMHSCSVVLASRGYPENPETGKLITFKNKETNNYAVTIAGGRLENNNLFTSGGRVINVTTTAVTLELAKEKTYESIHNIEFEGMYYRKDIGK
jgi:phosphoribosylamine--glycine ligase